MDPDPFSLPDGADSHHTVQSGGAEAATTEQSGWPAAVPGDSETPGAQQTIAQRKDQLLYAKDEMIARLDESVRCV